MRHDDPADGNFQVLRKTKDAPSGKITLGPGNVLIPSENLAIMVVVASSVAVTVYDVKQQKGGLCHFIHAIPPESEKPTAMYGFPACVALLNSFLTSGSKPKDLHVGIYGGAIPDWANAKQREISRHNVAIVHDVLKRKGIKPFDEDTGGHRGRKIMFSTGTNDIAIVRTENVRKSDWFPDVPANGAIHGERTDR